MPRTTSGERATWSGASPCWTAAYLLLLLEFQSTQDRWMALRVMVYAGLLWQQIVRERRLTPDAKLPPVFPVVIYNGDARWVAPLELNGLIGLPPGADLWAWQPGARYHLLDEGRFPEADLASRDTLTALLFRLEQTRSNCRRWLGRLATGSFGTWTTL